MTKNKIPTCQICKEESMELFEDNHSSKLLCKSCYDKDMNNKRRSDDSRFKEYIVKKYG